VVDRGRASFGLPSLADRRQAGQIGLVVLMIAALGAILLARGGGTGSPGIAGGASPSPQASLVASPQPTPRSSPSPAGSAGPSPSGAPASAKPSPTAKPRTYTVKSGDTLSGIASRFHTTPKAIERANGLKSPYVIHPGQVLKLP
jgi:nucleoid-associated protein YgaU